MVYQQGVGTEMFIRSRKRGLHTYLQIVENHRDGSKVIQTTIANLGRLDILNKTGGLDSLLRSGAKFSEKLVCLLYTSPSPRD